MKSFQNATLTSLKNQQNWSLWKLWRRWLTLLAKGTSGHFCFFRFSFFFLPFLKSCACRCYFKPMSSFWKQDKKKIVSASWFFFCSKPTLKTPSQNFRVCPVSHRCVILWEMQRSNRIATWMCESRLTKDTQVGANTMQAQTLAQKGIKVRGKDPRLCLIRSNMLAGWNPQVECGGNSMFITSVCLKLGPSL